MYPLLFEDFYLGSEFLIYFLLFADENKDYDLPVTTRTLAGIRREGKDRGRGQVTGFDWKQTGRVCAFAESENTLLG